MIDGNWKDPLIRDGFSQRAYISEREGLSGEIRFSYRPMLPESVDETEAERRKVKGKSETHIVIKAILSRLVSWDVVDPKTKQPTQISLDSVRRLRWGVLYSMYNIICGLEPTELDPLWDEGKGDELPPLEESLLEQVKN